MLSTLISPSSSIVFFFNDTATTEIYTLSLHDALPIYEYQPCRAQGKEHHRPRQDRQGIEHSRGMFNSLAILARSVMLDRKSTRLNSSHLGISYAVFCFKKKLYARHQRAVQSPIVDVQH